MTRIKSAALTTLAAVIALASFGFFATFGLALIGMFAALGLIGAMVAGIAPLFARKDAPAEATAHSQA